MICQEKDYTKSDWSTMLDARSGQACEPWEGREKRGLPGRVAGWCRRASGLQKVADFVTGSVPRAESKELEFTQKMTTRPARVAGTLSGCEEKPSLFRGAMH